VLYVQRYPDGGSVTSLLDLLRGLDRERYRPVVAFRTPNPFVREFEAAGVTVEVLFDAEEAASEPTPNAALARRSRDGSRSSSLRREVRRIIRRDLPAARRLLRVARDHDVDLVHANNTVLANRDALLVAARIGVPAVVHVRWVHQYRRDAALFVDRLLARRASRFLFISEVVAEHSALLAIPADRRQILDNPFHTEDYAVEAPPGLRGELGLPEDARVVLHVARITPWKGQDVFLRAMAAVLERHPGTVALLLGAPGDEVGERFQRELEALVDELGIGDRVVFAGARRDIPEVLALADVVVHCSTTPEPFGRVIVEAMAAGRAVVGADAGGVPEIIDAGITGVLVPPGDPAALADAVSDLLDDPAAAAAMAARAQAAVEERFSIETHARAVCAVYDEVLAGRSGRTGRSRRFRGARRGRRAGGGA
jgi:glycosyltransferase involved in cell wall biosynthesis